MSHSHGHDDHGHSHSTGGHSHAAAAEEGPGPAPLSVSQRYEMEDLFRGEAPENQHFLKVLGIVLLLVFLGVSLAYPFLFLGK